MASTRPTIRAATTAALLSFALTGCGSSSSTLSSTATRKRSSSAAANATETPRTSKVKVAISNYAYHPATIIVAAGTKVTFTNHDQTPHTATNTSAFDTGALKPGHSATVALTKPGTYTYYCQFHAFMSATIVVK